MRKFFKKSLLSLNILLVLFTFVVYIAKYISPNVFWPISITGIFFPLVFIGNICFILFWAFKKSKYFFFSFFALLVGLNNIKSFVNVKAAEPDQKNSIRFVSYNMAGLYSYRNLKSEAEKNLWKNKFHRFLNQKGAVELMSLQEVHYNQIDFLKKTFGLNHGFRHPTLGTAIISKYPIVNKGIVDLGKTSNSVVWVDIKLNEGKTIRVYSIHLQSNRITKTANDLAKKADLEDKETYRKIKNVFTLYKRSAQTRDNQAKKIINHIKTSPYPTIATGDFNDTPQSIVYAQFNQIMKDGFVEKGNGLGTTFAGSIPLLRIDYIFAEKEFHFLDYNVFYGNYSDHYPVVSNIVLN